MKKTMLNAGHSRRDFLKAAGAAGLGAVTASTVLAAEQPGHQADGTPKHPVVHFEIGCRDLAVAKDFYQKMFDWRIDEQAQIAGAGLAGHLTALGHEPFHYTTFYIQVDNVAEAIAKAESLGGKNVVGPINIPTGTFALIRDPQENVIGLLKSK
jgi:uncharacterized protein